MALETRGKVLAPVDAETEVELVALTELDPERVAAVDDDDDVDALAACACSICRSCRSFIHSTVTVARAVSA